MGKKTVRVFLDSNVILSGLLSDQGAPRIILDLLSLKLPALAGVTGRYNIIEIERNLAGKIPSAVPMYREYVPRMNLEIVPLPSPKELRGFSGRISDKDVPVLASAAAGRADYLVTGDKKDFSQVRDDVSFRILSPSEFLDVVLPEILNRYEDGEE